MYKARRNMLRKICKCYCGEMFCKASTQEALIEILVITNQKKELKECEYIWKALNLHDYYALAKPVHALYSRDPISLWVREGKAASEGKVRGFVNTGLFCH